MRGWLGAASVGRVQGESVLAKGRWYELLELFWCEI